MGVLGALLFALLPPGLGTAFIACASDEASSGEPDASAPPLDASHASDASPGLDAACPDCAFFPTECGGGRFCPVDVNIEPTDRLRALSGSSPEDIWAVGTRGVVVHGDGTKWLRSTLGDGEALTSVVVVSRDEVWAAGMMQTVYVRSASGDGGASWAAHVTTEAPDTPGFGYGAVRSASRSRTGATWFVTEGSGGQSSVLTQARRIPEGIETASLTSVEESRYLAAFAISENEVWTVGAVGSAYRVTEAASSAPVVSAFNTQTFASLRGVWGASSNDVWAVGSEGTVRHYSGSGRVWDVALDIPIHATLRAITGTSASDIWAVGDDAVVIHFDGARWSRVAVAQMGTRRPALHAVWAASPHDVWIAGDGVLLSLGAEGAAP